MRWLSRLFRNTRLGRCSGPHRWWLGQWQILVRTETMRMDDAGPYWMCPMHRDQYYELMEEQWAEYYGSVR